VDRNGGSRIGDESSDEKEGYRRIQSFMENKEESRRGRLICEREKKKMIRKERGGKVGEIGNAGSKKERLIAPGTLRFDVRGG